MSKTAEYEESKASDRVVTRRHFFNTRYDPKRDGGGRLLDLPHP